MALYRVYMIGSDRHIKGVENITCATDQEACVEAERMVKPYTAVEVWDGRRLVAQIGVTSQTVP